MRCYNAAMSRYVLMLLVGMLLLFIGVCVLFVTAVDTQMEMGDRLTMLEHKRMMNVVGYIIVGAGTMLTARGARGQRP